MNPHDLLRSLTPKAFQSLGVDAVAFIKAEPLDGGGEAFAICGADGAVLSRVRDRATAVALIRQNGMAAASLH